MGDGWQASHEDSGPVEEAGPEKQNHKAKTGVAKNVNQMCSRPVVCLG